QPRVRLDGVPAAARIPAAQHGADRGGDRAVHLLGIDAVGRAARAAGRVLGGAPVRRVRRCAGRVAGGAQHAPPVRVRARWHTVPVSNAPIGIFDSGVGGLTVARAIMDQLPAESLRYVGDTANAPYGPRPLSDIRARTLEQTDALVEEGVK